MSGRAAVCGADRWKLRRPLGLNLAIILVALAAFLAAPLAWSLAWSLAQALRPRPQCALLSEGHSPP